MTPLQKPLQPSGGNNLQWHSSKLCATTPFKFIEVDENAPVAVCNTNMSISQIPGNLQHAQLCNLSEKEASSHPATLLCQIALLRQLHQSVLPKLDKTIPHRTAIIVKLSEHDAGGYACVKNCKYTTNDGFMGLSFLSKSVIQQGCEMLMHKAKQFNAPAEVLGVVIAIQIADFLLNQKMEGKKVMQWLDKISVSSVLSSKMCKVCEDFVSAGMNIINSKKAIKEICDWFLDLKMSSHAYEDAVSAAAESWFSDSIISSGLDWIISISTPVSLAQIK
ncbi:hypothetical protein BJ741DRAFT_666021 [Chytriomyces cf. hyalinus JEL632]|nr:hypothetical protein BJ741DRAFT_666021 [Chytriomyces cf. hyalinus JEL632]